MLEPPKNIRLYGSTLDEAEKSRGTGSVRVAFEQVGEVDKFVARVNGGPDLDFVSGSTIDNLLPNTVVELQLRAVKAGEMDSSVVTWRTVTRPPTPPVPQVLQGQEGELFVHLFWSIPENFRGATVANSVLTDESTGGIVGTYALVDRIPVQIAYSKLLYSLRTRVPGTTLPSDVLGGAPNLSFSSDVLVYDITPSRRRMSVGYTEAYVANIRRGEIDMLGRLSL